MVDGISSLYHQRWLFLMPDSFGGGISVVQISVTERNLG
jgi:hypothetical protein